MNQKNVREWVKQVRKICVFELMIKLITVHKTKQKVNSTKNISHCVIFHNKIPLWVGKLCENVWKIPPKKIRDKALTFTLITGRYVMWLFSNPLNLTRGALPIRTPKQQCTTSPTPHYTIHRKPTKTLKIVLTVTSQVWRLYDTVVSSVRKEWLPAGRQKWLSYAFD